MSRLNDWLKLLETRHPKEIDLGLRRIRRVADSLALRKPAGKVVSIAGTNGKGSCVAALYGLLLNAGLRVAAYTSPHLVAFNERISINGSDAEDQAICDAFERIENSRGAVSLTYFEFATLAALLLMESEELDVAILEVGLGGRLDAVNLVDADIAVVTSIALDHQDWLGSDLNGIAGEKIAIGRAGKPLIFGEAPAEVDVVKLCSQQGVRLLKMEEDFSLSADGSFRSKSSAGLQPLHDRLNWGSLPPTSVACALEACQQLQLPEALRLRPDVLSEQAVPGRFQELQARGKCLVLDVAHNPAAAEYLAQKLAGRFADTPLTAVFAVMADKDIEGIVAPLKPLVQKWLLPGLKDVPRAAEPAEILPFLYNAQPVGSVCAALDLALSDNGCGAIVVCGSFFTVGQALEWLRAGGIEF